MQGTIIGKLVEFAVVALSLSAIVKAQKLLALFATSTRIPAIKGSFVLPQAQATISSP